LNCGKNRGMDVPTYRFKWRGKYYEALSSWEIGWVKWAMRNKPKALDSFIRREMSLKRKLRMV